MDGRICEKRMECIVIQEVQKFEVMCSLKILEWNTHGQYNWNSAITSPYTDKLGKGWIIHYRCTTMTNSSTTFFLISYTKYLGSFIL